VGEKRREEAERVEGVMMIKGKESKLIRNVSVIYIYIYMYYLFV